VCTCGGDTDDKCPDIIPGNLVGQLLPYWSILAKRSQILILFCLFTK
jgi:hypothetical protein